MWKQIKHFPRNVALFFCQPFIVGGSMRRLWKVINSKNWAGRRALKYLGEVFPLLTIAAAQSHTAYCYQLVAANIRETAFSWHPIISNNGQPLLLFDIVLTNFRNFLSISMMSAWSCKDLLIVLQFLTSIIYPFQGLVPNCWRDYLIWSLRSAYSDAPWSIWILIS